MTKTKSESFDAINSQVLKLHQKLVNLQPIELDAILEASGYFDNDITDIKFLKMTDSGSYAYETKFIDPCEGSEETGYVFVSIRDGKLQADF